MPNATFTAEVEWNRDEQDFLDGRYSRRHVLRFDGGVEVPGSASPQSVRVPFSDPSAVDPEEALVGAVSACHMLWFLSLAAQAGLRVDRYRDAASGVLTPNERGKRYLSRVTLRPQIEFSGARRPTPAELVALHAAAHAECYIANSLRGEVVVEALQTH
jgi:organic hydroperoxide reductase OsmC/OhrA